MIKGQNKKKLKQVAHKSTYRGKHRFVNPGLMGSPSAGPMLIEGQPAANIQMSLPRSVLPVSGGLAEEKARKVDQYTTALADAQRDPTFSDSASLHADPCVYDPAMKNAPACR